MSKELYLCLLMDIFMLIIIINNNLKYWHTKLRGEEWLCNK